MRGEQRMIDQVLQVVRQGDGEQIHVVLCSDGKLGISRDGRLMDMLQWPREQLEECIAFAERFAQTTHFSDDGNGASQTG